MAISGTESILDITRRYLIGFGTEVVQNRALPDLRDGLKPVQRRILWSAKIEAPNSGPPRKAANVIGTCIGKFHPHGDQSIYQALVNMTHAPYPTIEGHGNYGNPYTKEGPAAYRYTECRVSKFGLKAYLDPDYLAVTPMHDNYDGEMQEPLHLPCLVPAILMNDGSGIAVGVTGGFPSVGLDGLMKAIKHILDGNKFTTSLAVKWLTFVNRDGGVCTSTSEEIKTALSNPDALIRFRPDYKINEAAREVLFTHIPRSFSYPKMVQLAANKWSKFIDRVDDASTIDAPNQYVAMFKRTVPRDQLAKLAKEWAKANESSTKIALNVTVRLRKNDLVLADQVDFKSVSVTALLHAWVEYRVDLERRMQANKIANYDKALHRAKLFYRVFDFIDAIVKIIKKEKEPAEKIMKLMKITLEEANMILDMQLRRLTSLSKVSIKEQIANLESEKSKSKAIIKKPNDRIMQTLKEIASTVE